MLSRFGLHMRGRASRLKLNYRTTAQNLGLAQQILEGADWVDGEDQQEDASGYRSVRSGPAPRIVPVASLTAEYDLAAETVSDWLAGESVEPESVAILVRDQWQREQVVAALAEWGVRTRAIDRGKVPAGLPVVLTMHRAKGTEFAKVLLLGVSENKVPTAVARRNPIRGGAGRGVVGGAGVALCRRQPGAGRTGDQLQRCAEPLAAVSRTGRGEPNLQGNLLVRGAVGCSAVMG